ncbi:MAG: hypothetical protein RLZZ437_2600 [Pseudomonadota bacterium]|jgi:hypothetical protein
MLDNSFLRSIIIMVCVSAVLGLLGRIMAGRKPALDEDDDGMIAPNRVAMGAFALLCLLIGGVAGWAALTDADALVPAGLLSVAFLSFSAVMGTSLMPVYNIEWSEDGVTGPVSLWFPPFGPQRGTIYWEKIDSVGKDNMGNFYIEDRDGRRIRWNFAYNGFPVLMLRIEEECPWLFEQNTPQHG